MRTVSLVLVAGLLAACAHTTTERVVEVRTESANEKVVERVAQKATAGDAPSAALPMSRPEDSYARVARWGVRGVSGDVLEVEVPPGGLKFAELFRFVAETAGCSILYEENNAIMKTRAVAVVGAVRVARSDLVAWAQDVCQIHGLVLVPWGPADRRAYVALDQANPSTTSAPQFVAEADLPAYAGRTGLFVLSVLSLPRGVDAAKARSALAQLSTKTAGMGRVSDIPDGHALVVADFAHIVASMRRLLDEMAIAQFEHQ